MWQEDGALFYAKPVLRGPKAFLSQIVGGRWGWIFLTLLHMGGRFLGHKPTTISIWRHTHNCPSNVEISPSQQRAFPENLRSASPVSPERKEAALDAYRRESIEVWRSPALSAICVCVLSTTCRGGEYVGKNSRLYPASSQNIFFVIWCIIQYRTLTSLFAWF